jgi:hypothetical protein
LPSGDGDSGSPGGPNANTFVFKINVLAGDFNQDNVVDGSDFGVWNANKFTNTNGSNQFMDDEFRRGDATGDGFIDGQDFAVWNSMKFTSITGFSGPVVNNPSSSWLTSYQNLLNQYQIFINGQINTSLTQSQWQAFSSDLIVHLATL